MSNQVAPNRTVADSIVIATRLLTQGQKLKDVAAELKVAVETIKGWRKRHPELWKSAKDATIGRAVLEVRAVAGTNAVLADCATYMRTAMHVDRWSRKATGQPLFVPPPPAATASDGGNHTVTTFLERYYIPVCLAEASPETVKLYRAEIRKWAVLTGDPPLREISNETMARFREALQAYRKRNGSPLSVHTIRTCMRHAQILLDKAGPPRPRNWDAAGFIPYSPWAKLPRPVWGEPKIVPEEWINACYEAAVQMERPSVDGVKPREWWQTLIAVALNTALRCRSLFGLRMAHLDWNGRRIVVPAEIMKTGKGLTLPMNDVVYRHLWAIRGTREHVFPWDCSQEWFRRQFKRLQVLAGIPKEKTFGLHALRRTAATILWKHSPQAAQLMLGHATQDITKRSYVNAEEVLAGALATLPQPAAFGPSKGAA
jgi:integrase